MASGLPDLTQFEFLLLGYTKSKGIPYWQLEIKQQLLRVHK